MSEDEEIPGLKPIMGFKGEYRWLSNFWPAPVSYEGIDFTSTEHAYQAAKTLDLEERKRIATLTAGEAKKAGKKLVVRSDWNEVKLSVMENLLRQKFAIPELRQKLLDTGEAEIVEQNTWHDVFWGVCGGIGENHLGKLLMKIRSEIRSSGEKS